jgi:hypothetical protein
MAERALQTAEREERVRAQSWRSAALRPLQRVEMLQLPRLASPWCDQRRCTCGSEGRGRLGQTDRLEREERHQLQAAPPWRGRSLSPPQRPTGVTPLHRTGPAQGLGE